MSEKVCSEPGCDKPVHARERCGGHYQAWRKRELGLGGKAERVSRKRRGISTLDKDDALDARLRAVLAEKLAAI